jgi:hypothetical protein
MIPRSLLLLGNTTLGVELPFPGYAWNPPGLIVVTGMPRIPRTTESDGIYIPPEFRRRPATGGPTEDQNTDQNSS